MSSNQTTNYQLPIWAAEDKFQREEFNEANQKLDNALAQVQQTLTQKADSTAVTAIQNTLSGKADSATVNTMQQTITQMQQTLSAERIVVGSYTGDGADTRTISLPFTPKLLMVSGYYGNTGVQYSNLTIAFGGYGHWIRQDGSGRGGNITIVENGFQIQGMTHNIPGFEEHYIAIC